MSIFCLSKITHKQDNIRNILLILLNVSFCLILSVGFYYKGVHYNRLLLTQTALTYKSEITSCILNGIVYQGL